MIDKMTIDFIPVEASDRCTAVVERSQKPANGMFRLAHDRFPLHLSVRDGAP